MPGLLRGMARTAVVAGTATAVSNRVSRRQSDALGRSGPGVLRGAGASPGGASAGGAPAPSGESRIDQLREMGELKAQGVLTDQEFEAEARILG